ncbi:hypothetical protein NLO95_16130, partial [Pseudomonas syringae]|nr:hypothetical protein [Pseudomonas syringae]
ASDGKTRQKQAKKRSLGVLNEHFSPVFNAVLPSAVVFTQSVQALFAAKQRSAMDTAAPAENV